MNHSYRLLLGILSVWRVTHLLQAEDGPWDSVVYLRERAGDGFWGRLLDCFYCLSLWTATPFALLLGQKPREIILLWPALSAGAIMLELVTEHRQGEASAHFFEDSEDEYVLWQEADAGSQKYADEAALTS